MQKGLILTVLAAAIFSTIGVCWTLPVYTSTPATGCICPDIFQPVCGPDNKTYSNTCFAQCAGIDVVTGGSCNNTGSLLTTPSPMSQSTTSSLATRTSTTSTAVTQPGCSGCVGCCLTITSPAPFDVCGSDGITYPTFCDAICAGVSHTIGACTTTTSSATYAAAKRL